MGCPPSASMPERFNALRHTASKYGVPLVVQREAAGGRKKAPEESRVMMARWHDGKPAGRAMVWGRVRLMPSTASSSSSCSSSPSLVKKCRVLSYMRTKFPPAPITSGIIGAGRSVPLDRMAGPFHRNPDSPGRKEGPRREGVVASMGGERGDGLPAVRAPN